MGNQCCNNQKLQEGTITPSGERKEFSIISHRLTTETAINPDKSSKKEAIGLSPPKRRELSPEEIQSLFDTHHPKDATIQKTSSMNHISLKGQEILKQVKDFDFGEQDFDLPIYGPLMYSDGSTYKGQYKNELQHGFGQVTYLDGTVYTGNFNQGVYSGLGRLTSFNGYSYQGEFQENKYNGYGEFLTPKFEYRGYWKNNELEGKAKIYFSDGGYFEGQFKGDKMNGKGKMIYSPEEKYVGDYVDDMYNGEGTLRLTKAPSITRATRYTRGSGKTARCMARASSPGRMGRSTLGITSKGRSRVMEGSLGK